MMIDIKEIQEILNNCNVHFYDMYIDTDNDCVQVDMNELSKDIDFDTLTSDLGGLFVEVIVEDTTVYLSYYGMTTY